VVFSKAGIGAAADLMKVLITGASGQVGRELQACAPPGWEVTGLQHKKAGAIPAGLDITDGHSIAACLELHQPDVVINAAAYTDVDGAEGDPQTAFAVNTEATGILAEETHRRGSRLIHISTDFVFDGSKSSPYLPGDATAPINVYGASKRDGELRVMEHTGGKALIIRSAWIYAAGGRNFVSSMLRLMTERDVLRVVADQIGTPTWGRSLAQAIWAAAQKPALAGIYHWTDAGVASWYDFAVAIQAEASSLGLLSRAVPIQPIRTEDYPTPAKRPSYSVLDKTSSWRDFSLTPVHWRHHLREMLMELA